MASTVAESASLLYELSTAPVPLYKHRDYAVGWLCALPRELTAAEAMFDAVHPSLGNPPGDHNIYKLGSISGHNVVIACLPAGKYGTTAAANVVNSMLRTFRSIEIPLLVGIGGGVPGVMKRSFGNNEHKKLDLSAPESDVPEPDVRLCDIVVSVPTSESPAVVQYDYGKIGNSGRLDIKGVLNKPKDIVLEAVAHLQSAHTLAGSEHPRSMILRIVDTVLKERPALAQNGFRKPDRADRLFAKRCEHGEDDTRCDDCIMPQEIRRPSRPKDDPIRIHYGQVASGNAVMKNRSIRDSIARPRNIICFEMEAAGVMDTFQPVVIRGICDYCDERKHKEFQSNASLVAAAYTKQLLAIIPKTISEGQALSRQNLLQSMVDGLNFIDADVRLGTISIPHRETCDWLLRTKEYTLWLDDRHLGVHCGLLWIKGKAGVGKSTLMKFAYLAQNNPEVVVISFFFNARGHELVRTTTGMYRSLLYQLLSKLPGLRYKLNFPASPNTLVKEAEVIKNLFISAIEELEGVPVILFIDALDESEEDEIRDLIRSLEPLLRKTGARLLNFRVCCSSRHYPRISCALGIELRMEDATGHLTDLHNYVHSELHLGQGRSVRKLKNKVVHRSQGVFLWAVLVVRILQKDYDHGRHTQLEQRYDTYIDKLQEKLATIPSKLTELFRGILLHDEERREDLVLCIQWLLYARRPLSMHEFYSAMLAYTRSPSAVPTFSTMKNFITSVSKGLVELTHSDPPIVQLIHESTREFLLTTSTMQELWSGFDKTAPGPAHEALRFCCSRYVRMDIFGQAVGLNPLVGYASLTSKHIGELFTRKLPFASYAIENILFHADKASRYGVSQSEFIHCFPLHSWIRLNNTLNGLHWSNSSTANMLTILQEGRYEHLIQSLSICESSETEWSVYNIFRHIITMIASSLADNFLSFFKQTSKTRGLSIATSNKLHQPTSTEQLQDQQRLAFEAAEVGDLSMLQRIIGDTLRNDEPWKLIRECVPLIAAAGNGHEETVEWLLSKGANPHQAMFTTDYACGPISALHMAAMRGHGSIVRMLLEGGSHVDARAYIELNQTALHLAATAGHVEVVDILLQHGSSLSSRDIKGRSALIMSEQAGHMDVYNLLTKRDEDLVDRMERYQEVRSDLTDYSRLCW